MRSGRIVQVTAAVSLVGAVVGGLCGFLTLVAIAFLNGAGLIPPFRDPRVLLLPVAFGACVGAIAAPAILWGILRHVSIGRAALWTGVGTIVGALVGQLLQRFTQVFPLFLFGALAGFVVAGVALRLRARSAATA